jgi:hypothetical protein
VVSGQKTRLFWESDAAGNKTLRRDIVVSTPGGETIIADTKWKDPQGPPSGEDVRQIYAYLRYFGARKGILLYPARQGSEDVQGWFAGEEGLCCRQVFLDMVRDGRVEFASHLPAFLIPFFYLWVNKNNPVVFENSRKQQKDERRPKEHHYLPHA